MVIDYAARSRLLESQNTKTLVKGMTDAVLTAVNAQQEKQQAPSLVIKHEEDQNLVNQVGKLGQALAMIYNIIKKPIVLPKIFQIQGKVEVERPIEVRNLGDLKKYFESLEATFNKLLYTIQSMPQPQVKLPTIKIPEVIKADNTELNQLIKDFTEKLDQLQPQGEKLSMKRTNELLESIASRPQMVPQPVNNVWMNPAQGFVKSTTTTVGTTLTTLPGYGRLFNRRSLVIYNNSGNTIYVGGSDVTTSNGIPVSSTNYGLSMDIGYDCILYAIASTNGNDIRVLEVSKDQVGDSPQE